jgi:glycogen phosphorylase
LASTFRNQISTAGYEASGTSNMKFMMNGALPGVFGPLREVLLTGGDHYMHLADLCTYLEADGRLVALYRDADAWAHKAILNVTASGGFSSDRMVTGYATEIWHVRPCPVA